MSRKMMWTTVITAVVVAAVMHGVCIGRKSADTARGTERH